MLLLLCWVLPTITVSYCRMDCWLSTRTTHRPKFVHLPSASVPATAPVSSTDVVPWFSCPQCCCCLPVSEVMPQLAPGEAQKRKSSLLNWWHKNCKSFASLYTHQDNFYSIAAWNLSATSYGIIMCVTVLEERSGGCLCKLLCKGCKKIRPCVPRIHFYGLKEICTTYSCYGYLKHKLLERLCRLKNVF